MVNEGLLMAKMDYECKIRGANRLAFPPVVAGGARANTIHYIKNDQRIRPRDMVLMDAGMIPPFLVLLWNFFVLLPT